MIGSNAFNYINVLNKAADASWTRNAVIANNIANNDTPDYKRKDILFEDYLKAEVTKDYFDGGDLNKRIANVDLSKLGTTLYTDQSELSYRYDGNNVDINTTKNTRYIYYFFMRYYMLYKRCCVKTKGS